MEQNRKAEQNVKVAVRGVTKRFGDYVANDAIDLEIEDGEFLTLLGPSGCGKTTLMRLIAGLEQCTLGHILIDGRDVTGVPPRMRNVGMVFQQYSLFPHMTVAENIAYGLRVKRLPSNEIAARVEEMLKLVRLPDLGSRMPSALSGGQQQRIALARALATRPSLLMLDEPLGALDLKLRRQMQAELKRIHRETGITFLFVTHDQEEALNMSDRIAVMRQGRIEQLADPHTLYARPLSEFVADFIGDVTLLECLPDREAEGRRAFLVGEPKGVSIPVPVGCTNGPFRLVVRPEHVLIDGTGSKAWLEAEVRDVTQESGTTMLHLVLPGGTALRSRLLGSRASDFTVGSRIGVSIEGAEICLPMS
jgi:spermidine/putrescine ABC transporter ATP-binding subunit